MKYLLFFFCTTISGTAQAQLRRVEVRAGQPPVVLEAVRVSPAAQQAAPAVRCSPDSYLTPTAVLILPEAVYGLRLSSPGTFVVDDQAGGCLTGKFNENTYSVATPPLRPGEMTIYCPGSRRRLLAPNSCDTLAMEVEVLGKDPWPQGISEVILDVPKIKKAMAFAATVKGSAWRPVGVVHATRPISNLWWQAAPVSIDLRVRGPFEKGSDRTKDPTAPLSDTARLEPGSYLVEVRQKPALKDSGELPVSVALSQEDSLLDPLEMAGTVPADLPLGGRTITTFFPFLPTTPSDVEQLPAIVIQRLFLKASPSLLVFAKFDLDGTTAKSLHGGTDYPHKNEPLLLLRGYVDYVLSPDGFVYETKVQYVNEKPEDSLMIPENVRPYNIDFSSLQTQFDPRSGVRKHSTFVTLPADDPVMKQYLAAGEKWQSCVDRVLGKYGGRNAGYFDIVSFRSGKVSRIENAKDWAWNEADRTCHFKQHDAQLTSLEKQMASSWSSQRQKHLNEIRAKFAR